MPSPSSALSATRQSTIRPDSPICEGCDRPSMDLAARGDSWLCKPCRDARPVAPQETAARLRKAIAIADYVASLGYTAADVCGMSEVDWELAQRGAMVSRPSLETRIAVAHLLEQRARRAEAASAAR